MDFLLCTLQRRCACGLETCRRRSSQQIFSVSSSRVRRRRSTRCKFTRTSLGSTRAPAALFTAARLIRRTTTQTICSGSASHRTARRRGTSVRRRSSARRAAGSRSSQMHRHQPRSRTRGLCGLSRSGGGRVPPRSSASPCRRPRVSSFTAPRPPIFSKTSLVSTVVCSFG